MSESPRPIRFVRDLGFRTPVLASDTVPRPLRAGRSSRIELCIGAPIAADVPSERLSTVVGISRGTVR